MTQSGEFHCCCPGLFEILPISLHPQLLLPGPWVTLSFGPSISLMTISSGTALPRGTLKEKQYSCQQAPQQRTTLFLGVKTLSSYIWGKGKRHLSKGLFLTPLFSLCQQQQHCSSACCSGGSKTPKAFSTCYTSYY